MNAAITVLGGDLRQVHLAQMLLDDGNDVATWGLDQGGAPNSVPLNIALERDILILPLPVCRGGRLNLPLTDTELRPEQLWPRLRYDQLLLGGMTRDLSRQLMVDFGLTLLDYYDREETQVATAVPTVEAVGHGLENDRTAALQPPRLPHEVHPDSHTLPVPLKGGYRSPILTSPPAPMNPLAGRRSSCSTPPERPQNQG